MAAAAPHHDGEGGVRKRRAGGEGISTYTHPPIAMYACGEAGLAATWLEPGEGRGSPCGNKRLL